MWSSRSGRAPPAQSGSCRGPAHTQAQGGSNEDKTRQTEEGAGVDEEPGGDVLDRVSEDGSRLSSGRGGGGRWAGQPLQRSAHTAPEKPPAARLGHT